MGARARRWIRRWLGTLAGAIRPPVVYVGDGVLLARTAAGDIIYLDAQDVSLTPAIALSGEWEPGIARAFLRVLKPGMSVVDVGANCGYFSLLAARTVGAAPGGRVIAIDANPRMTDLVERSFAANGYASFSRVVFGAVMEKEGEVELGLPGKFMGSASILIGRPGDEREVRRIVAPGKPLEGFLGGDRRVDLLKIDAEGAEQMIWAGAQPVIQANPGMIVFMEFSPPMLSSSGPPGDFLNAIRAQGFSVSIVEPDSTVREIDNASLLARDLSELMLRRAPAS